MRRADALLRAAVVLALALPACSESTRKESPPCDEQCLRSTALRGFRETLKLIYNMTVQGKPVGAQEGELACPLGGRARVFGVASSNALQGATEVELTYELDRCRYMQRDDEPPENYDLTITGTVSQRGTLAVQPSATTALSIRSDSIALEGTVYDPPEPFVEVGCALALGQSGNDLSGEVCGMSVGVHL